MNVLLDTHTLVWSIMETGQLSRRVIDLLENPVNEVNVSTISLWEISIKYSLGKLELRGIKPESFPELIQNAGFQVQSISPNVAASYHQLPRYPEHKDPFDRFLIWQAIQEKQTLLSKDQSFGHYVKNGLKLLW